MNGAFTTDDPVAPRISFIGAAILADGEDLATMEDHGDVVMLVMFRRVTTLLTQDIGVNVAI
jgi:hypothetical protein